MDLSRQNEDFSCKSDLGVNYPHLTLNSDTYNSVTNPNRFMENSLSPSIKGTSFTTYSYEEEGRLNSTKPGNFVPKQNFNGIFSSNSVKPFRQDVGLASEKCAFGGCLEESRKNPEESLGMCFSQGPICDTEDDTSNFTKLNGEESPPKIDFAVLLKTLQNLSDLLVFYCSNGEYALKKQDNMALKHVINNLNSCMLKIPQFTLKRKSVFSTDLHQDNNGNTENHNQLVREKKTGNITPCMKDEKFQDFVTVASDIAKTDEMTQAIKNALTKNFNGEEETLPTALLYKNLWLEAEAVICSTNFKARFDRMKGEMIKSKPLEAKDESQDVVNMQLFSRSKVHPDVKKINNLTTDTNYSIQESPIISNTSPTDDVIARFCKLKSRGVNSNSMYPTDTMIDSSSNVIPELKEADTIVSEIKSYHPASPVISTTNHEDDVIARFHELKSRGDFTSMNPTDINKDLSSSVFPGLKNINTLASETKSGISASPILSATNLEDDVVARFHIIKSRGDNFISMNPTDMIEDSSSNIFPGLKNINTLASETKSSITASPIISTTNLEDDVIARFHVLKSRGDFTSMNFTD